MKKILILLALFTGLIACENQKNTFPDFGYTSGFFPYQFPVRTLVLGDYIYDNANDNNQKFDISAAMGGVYENKESRIFKFVVDESLCTNAYFADGSPIRPLPKAYYQLSNDKEIVIDPGKFNGGVEVQLSDAFFNDPLAIKNAYVVPIRLTGVINLDTLLQGKAASASADPRIAGQWATLPKHFTMFGVKYINPFHGNFLHYGAASLSKNNSIVENKPYRANYIEQNEVSKLTTTGKTQVSWNTTFKTTSLPGQFTMLLNFASNDYIAPTGIACTIVQADGIPFAIKGTGKFVREGEVWGGEKRNTIYLSYTVDNDTYHYAAVDTLVMRDRAVVMEVYAPTIK
jgi:hypothetical protein